MSLVLYPLAFALLTTPAVAVEQLADSENCTTCHATKQTGFNTGHVFAAGNCVACHAGDADGQTAEAAHEGLIAFPGELASAERACGSCHRDRVASVKNNLMHTGHGFVRITRTVLDGDAAHDGNSNFQSLGDSVADSMLRKQCASCHLGQPKTKHALDVTFDRGGGCLACHINSYPQQSHPELTTNVEDGRCFGCHSRSGRISLSYAGLAEFDPPDDSAALQLADRRPVERLPADVHYVAGMGCIDCHTSVDLMGDAGAAEHQRQAVDIKCTDCHDNANPRIGLSEWRAELESMKKHIRFDAGTATRFLTTENSGTPLWHVELQTGAALLHTKNTGRELPIPRPDPNRVGHDKQHERLTCAACHSQWAPQCFGCHMEYDADGEQWDHIDRAYTAGRWADRRWNVNNSLPALGINSSGEIEPFVPGMIMTVDHPSLEKTKFVRRFAPLSPHTTGKSRSCASCHGSGTALGLGQGEFFRDGSELSFAPQQKTLQDGLPADAWTAIDSSLGGPAPVSGQRPFNSAEIKKIFEADTPAVESDSLE
ncbi:MAG: hypothetical protein KJN77_06450 [Gammaproteobacteria bacterium]|nr:hypothetical protein [Gammaproteobacteria bacterium]